LDRRSSVNEDGKLAATVANWMHKRKSFSVGKTGLQDYGEIFNEKVPANEKKAEKDPFHMTGFGITSYLDTTRGMIKMFSLIVTICIPMFYTYS